jgi:L-ascorbate metabolism protein UlaG (beta-lactamase superfamily)
MDITYYGHACFEIKINGKKLLFDPFISGNPLAKAIDIKTINPDFILISHGHEDHIADAVAIAKQSNATIIANFEIICWLAKHGIQNGHSMNIGGKFSFSFGNVKLFNAIHSSVLPDGTYGGNPCGFLVQSTEGNFYYAGDTGLTYDMKLIGEYMSIDFSLLPIGNNYTMGVDNAIIASEMIKCETVIGMHYDTFPQITIDKKDAIEKFNRAGNELILLNIGETFNFQKN